MVNFYSTIRDANQINGSLLWKMTEGYLNIGQASYKVVKLRGERIYLESASCEGTFKATAAKVASYFFFILPLCALIIREYYRHSYQFVIVPKNQGVDILENEKENAPLEDDQVLTTAYKMETVIAQLKEAQAQGTQLGLFVGRELNQSIPNEKGWLWCSLDVNPVKELRMGRLHLEMDFNDEKNMLKIQGLFDKVIADYSVIKFMTLPWDTMKSVLVCKREAECIAEKWSGSNHVGNELVYFPEKATMQVPMADLSENRQRRIDAFEKWELSIGKEEAALRYANYLKNMPFKEKDYISYMYSGDLEGFKITYRQHVLKENNLEPKEIDRLPELIVKIREYLLERFDSVELVSGLYPYREEAIKTDYWIARGPKTA